MYEIFIRKDNKTIISAILLQEKQMYGLLEQLHYKKVYSNLKLKITINYYNQ